MDAQRNINFPPIKNTDPVYLKLKRPVSFRLQKGENSSMECSTNLDFSLDDFDIEYYSTHSNHGIVDFYLLMNKWSLIPTVCPFIRKAIYILKRCLLECSPKEKFLTVRVTRPDRSTKSWVVGKNFTFNVKYTTVLTIRTTLHEDFRKKLEDLIDTSFSVRGQFSPLLFHPDHSTSLFKNIYITQLNSTKEKWSTETKMGLAKHELKEFRCPSTYMDGLYTGKLLVALKLCNLKSNITISDYFTRPVINPKYANAERQITVKGEKGGEFICSIESLRAASEVLQTQLESRWGGESLSTITIPGLSSEGIEALQEYLEFSHVRRATENFHLAVELLLLANLYIFSDLEEKLLNLIYLQPLTYFRGAESIISLYAFLVKTKVSNGVLQRMRGIVKLNACDIRSSEGYKLDSAVAESLEKCISSYDVTFDTISSLENFHSYTRELYARR